LYKPIYGEFIVYAGIISMLYEKYFS